MVQPARAGRRVPALPALVGVLALGALALGGCAAEHGGSHGKRGDVSLEELQTRLPGRYDNAAQARADAETGVAEPHEAVDLLIAPADAALIGKIAYYVRESVAGNPQRVLSQRIWVLGHATNMHTKEQYVEQRIYLFKEPERWAHVGDDPELLQSLIPEDLRQLQGCDLIWMRHDTVLEAHRRVEDCNPAARSEGLLLEQRIELRDNKLSMVEQQVGPDGLRPLPAAQADPFYRFVRRGAAN
ncbi:MAG TPA: CpcT/CpeT family chromophore lyase [Steroidobacteraceae bacterium]